MAALLLVGPKHPVTLALGSAIADTGAISSALAALDALPAIPKRRLLATWAAVLPV
jgi:hypothetical protein